jgi:hypothetical protein
MGKVRVYVCEFDVQDFSQAIRAVAELLLVLSAAPEGSATVEHHPATDLPAEPAAAPPRKPGRKPARQAVAPDQSGADRGQRIEKIAKFLLKVGHAGSADIARACNIPMGSITSLLKDPRFEKDDDGDYRAAY